MNVSTKSEKLFQEAKKLTPNGVHSSLRFFEPYPIFMARANGARMTDVDGNEYLDYHLGFGPVVLGHAHPRVTEAVRDQMTKGVIFGLSSELEVEVAKKVQSHVPSAEMTRFCNSGTEATYHAIRVARAFTGRSKVVKFEGAYHGWHDFVALSSGPSLKDAGPEETPVAVPDSEGLWSEAAKNTVVVPFNQPEILERTIRRHKNEIACLITEPILHGSATCIPPAKGFLDLVREVTSANEIVFILDEVVSGFRHDLGGAQRLFDVKPDLSTFAKGMANGFPVAAVCGREDIMNKFKPTGKVDYGGTYNGNSVSMAATLATIREMEDGKVHQHLFSLGERLRNRLNESIAELKVKAKVMGFGSVFQILFTDQEISNYRDALSSNKQDYLKFQRGLMGKGIFIIPQASKRCHISAAHTADDIDHTIDAATEVLRTLYS